MCQEVLTPADVQEESVWSRSSGQNSRVTVRTEHAYTVRAALWRHCACCAMVSGWLISGWFGFLQA
jgi:hypothetical protein